MAYIGVSFWGPSSCSHYQYLFKCQHNLSKTTKNSLTATTTDPSRDVGTGGGMRGAAPSPGGAEGANVPFLRKKILIQPFFIYNEKKTLNPKHSYFLRPRYSITRIPSVTASEVGTAQAWNLCCLQQRIVVSRSVFPVDLTCQSCLEEHIGEGDSPVRDRSGCQRYAFHESGCLGMQPKIGGKLHLKLNIGTRPIANKYREGKMKRTLKRELKSAWNR